MAKPKSKQEAPDEGASIRPAQEDILVVIHDKATKAKEKVMLLSDLLREKKVTIDELVETARSKKDTVKATLIEAMEFASKTNPDIINANAFQCVIESLKDDAPRVKWEAAKVIANTAHLFPKLLNNAVVNLLANTEHTGNVVRWSAATALSKIILLNTPLNKELIPATEAIIQKEEDNAVRKIYQQTLKKSRR